MICDDDLEFLRELQTELNIRPCYWVVRDRVRRPVSDDDSAEGWKITDESGRILSSISAITEIYEGIREAESDRVAADWLAEHGIGVGPDGRVVCDDETATEIINGDDPAGSGYHAMRYRDHWEIVPGTLFLTLKECDDHIKLNHYHYRSPQPYAVTAWCSPQLDRLIRILREADLSSSRREDNDL